MEQTAIKAVDENDPMPPLHVRLTRSMIVGLIVGIASAVQVVYAGLHLF